MPRFAEMTVAELLDAFSSPQPTPGGGTAAAVAGAMGTSLLMMVAGLAKSKTNTPEEKASLAEARTALAALRARFTSLADEDTAAFDEVMAAYKLPKVSDEEKAARKDTIQAALRRATEVPLDTCRAAAEALFHARTVAQGGNPTAASDVAVAIGLLDAAAAGGAQNVRINLGSLSDEAFRSRVEADLASQVTLATAEALAARSALSL